MATKTKEIKYIVRQKLVGASIVGGVLQTGRTITRVDLPAASNEKWQHLIDDAWIEEVKDDGEI
jgi:hypothetical protein